jgi:hypothetical protein
VTANSPYPAGNNWPVLGLLFFDLSYDFESERQPMLKRNVTLNPELAAEAKGIVALAFRNGPIEDVHAGKECPTALANPNTRTLRKPR